MIPLDILVLLVIGAGTLHLLYRTIAARDLLAASSLIAAWFLLAVPVRLLIGQTAMTPVWIAFAYPYAWGGMTALVWLVSNGPRADRHGIRLEGRDPRFTCLLLAFAALHAGVLACAPFSGGRTLAIYLMASPLMTLTGWLLYRVLVLASLKKQRVGWPLLVAGGIASALLATATENVLLPLLLRHF